MRIHVLSDLHMASDADKARAPAPVDADVVVLAGDILDSPADAVAWARAHFPQPVVVVAGNHEFFGLGLISAVRAGQAASDDRVHFLENDAVVIGGTRFLGATLWTDFELHGFENRDQSMRAARADMLDYHQIYEDEPMGGAMASRFTPASSIQKHQASREWLREMLATPFEGPTVVVTHHAPHPFSVAPLWQGHYLTPCFASDLEMLILSGQPDLWIHGHTHESFDYRFGATRIVCNPKGLGTGNRNFRPGMVVEVNRRNDHVATLSALVAGEIGWEEAKRRLGIVDEWAIRRDVVGMRPWTVVCGRYGVPVEAVAAVHRLTRPEPMVWPEAIGPEFDERSRTAATVLSRLDVEPLLAAIYEDEGDTKEAKP